MGVRKFGYIRVSSKDQNELRQLEAMKEKGIAKKLSLLRNCINSWIQEVQPMDVVPEKWEGRVNQEL
jgi:hypothetical protein